uniref:Uncharacterized protein n=2 Tax=Amphora coffeiformis TaxID=265554 RepID=A0A7S3P4V1_9STRA
MNPFDCPHNNRNESREESQFDRLEGHHSVRYTCHHGTHGMDQGTAEMKAHPMSTSWSTDTMSIGLGTAAQSHHTSPCLPQATQNDRKRPAWVSPSGRRPKHSRNNAKRTPNSKRSQQGKKHPPSFALIQEWHVVLGDMNCREGRTTEATKMLREVKALFQGNPKKEWIPRAIALFQTRLGHRFNYKVAQGLEPVDQIGQVLWRCTKKGMDKIETPHMYGYDGDSQPLFGTVKEPLECLTFFLESGDSPTLPKELARHKRELAKLRQSDKCPPDELMEEFAEHIKFFEQRIKNAEKGNVVSEAFLKELNLIPSFRKVWDGLKTAKSHWSGMLPDALERPRDAEDSCQPTCGVPNNGSLVTYSPSQSQSPAMQALPDPSPMQTPQQSLGRHWIDESSDRNVLFHSNLSLCHDLSETWDIDVGALIQRFQQDLDPEIVCALLSEIRRGHWSSPAQANGLDPPGRTLASTNHRGIDPEPSYDFRAQRHEAQKPQSAYQDIGDTETTTAENGHVTGSSVLASERTRHTSSQNNLGSMYNYAQGVQQDHTKAEGWYHKAAEQGHDDIGESNHDSRSVELPDTPSDRIQSTDCKSHVDNHSTSSHGHIYQDFTTQSIPRGDSTVGEAQTSRASIREAETFGMYPSPEWNTIRGTVPFLDRGESWEVSVPTAVAVAVSEPDLDRGDSGEISIPTSVCFRAPTVLGGVQLNEASVVETLPPPLHANVISIGTVDSTAQEASSGIELGSDSQPVGEMQESSHGVHATRHGAYAMSECVVPAYVSQDQIILNHVKAPEWQVPPDMVPTLPDPKSWYSLEDLSMKLDKHRAMLTELKIERNRAEEGAMLSFECFLNFFQDQLELANSGNATAIKLLTDLSATTAMENQWSKIVIQHNTNESGVDVKDESLSSNTKAVLAITSFSGRDEETGERVVVASVSEVDADLVDDLYTVSESTEAEAVSAYAPESSPRTYLPASRPDSPHLRVGNPVSSESCSDTAANNQNDMDHLAKCSQTRRLGESNSHAEQSHERPRGSRLRRLFGRVWRRNVPRTRKFE